MQKPEELMELEEMIKKVNELKKDNIMDLSSDQDLSLAIMNLISIEEHFFFTGAKTGNTRYYDLLSEIREMRKILLKKIIKEYEGEVWCISKHLLGASYRLMEVGTKLQKKGDKAEAEDMFQKSYELYSIFWGLNMKLINLGAVKKISDNDLSASEARLNKTDDHKNESDSNQTKSDSKDPAKNMGKKLGNILKRVINCCVE